MKIEELIKLLNENQGAIAVIVFLLGALGSFLFWLLKKDNTPSVHKDSPYISAGKNISAGGDIIVGGNKTKVVNEQVPTVLIKNDGFTYTQGRLDLIFENTGVSTAVIQNFKVGDNDTGIDEFTLAPKEPVPKQINVTGFRILSEEMKTPNFEIQYKDFSTNKKYKTVGTINQEFRPGDHNYNLGKIKDLTFLIQEKTLSKKEEEVLLSIRDSLKKEAYLLTTDQTGEFVKIGHKIFGQDDKPSTLREYVEALLSLENKGYLERKSEQRFILTGRSIGR